MFLKIMSEENLADHDPTKGYQIFDNVESAEFRKDGDKALVEVVFMNAKGEVETESWPISTNCYVLNSEGTTVSHFGPHGKPGKSRH